MRRSFIFLAVLLLSVSSFSLTEAENLNGFFPIGPQMQGIQGWAPDTLTTWFADKLGRLQVSSSSYSYYISSQWSDNPVGTPQDYINRFPYSVYSMVASHANSGALALTYWNTSSARNTYWNSFLTATERATYFYKSDASPKPHICIFDTGIANYLQPNVDGMTIVLGCETNGLAEDFYPGIAESNNQTSGPAFVGYGICPYLSQVAKDATTYATCLVCAKHPWHGGDIEDAHRNAAFTILRGNGNRRINPDVSCWNWAGFFYDAGYKDGDVFCSVLNEDEDSYYIIRGLNNGLPDTIATFPGSGTDGKWILRTHSWPVNLGGYDFADIIHIDKDGVATASDQFVTDEAGSAPLRGDFPISQLDDDELYPGPIEVEEVVEESSNPQPLPPPDGDCADVVIYSSDYYLLLPVRDHVQRLTTKQGFPIKAKVFLGPATFSNIQEVMAQVREANITYEEGCWYGCARHYPVLPGPIGILVGDKSRVRYNSWNDDPIANPCRQITCISYNDAGDVNGDGIAECPIMVLDAMGVDSLLTRLSTAEEWNAGQFVEPTRKALIFSGDNTSSGPAELITRNLDYLRVSYNLSGTPATLMKETDYPDFLSARAAGITAINQGVETLWFQGLATRIDDFTWLLAGNSYPKEQLTRKQRFLAIGPACEVTGVRWLGSYYWMYRTLGLNDPEKSVMIGVAGQMNGDYEHRHELALEVYEHELEQQTSGDYMAEVMWRINYVMATQFGEVNYARGNTLFANGLIRPPLGQLSPSSVEVTSTPSPTSRLIWSVPCAVGRDIYFTLSQGAKVDLDVYNIQSRHISTVIDGASFGPGVQRMTWYGRDANGEKVSSGMYFARLSFRDSSGLHQVTEKMLVVR